MDNLNLKDIFIRYKDKKFIFIEPSGNQGDQLIYFGAIKLANEIGLNYITRSYNEKFNKNRIIYLHGSGGFNKWWGDSPRILKNIRLSNPNNIIIVGPSTCSFEYQFLKNALPKDDENIIFFAREKITFDYFKRNFYKNTFLDEDTSFHLNKHDVLENFNSENIILYNFEDRFLKLYKKKRNIKNIYKLLLVRKDKESSYLPDIIDPEQYDFILDPVKILSYWKWVRLLSKASLITTNRLHSAILGTIIKKPVEIFANSYHKNRSVWEYSLKKRRVTWVGPKILAKTSTYNGVTNSKIRELYLRLFFSIII